MPETMAPARRPLTALWPNKRPAKKGVKITRAPGAIILFSDALVDI